MYFLYVYTFACLYCMCTTCVCLVLILYMYYVCVPGACAISVPHVCVWCLRRSEDRVASSGTGITDGVSCHADAGN